MRAFTICCVLCGPLLGILGCSNNAYTKKGPEVMKGSVTITNCNANPDTVQVHRGDDLTWNIDRLTAVVIRSVSKGTHLSPRPRFLPGRARKQTEISGATPSGECTGYCRYRYDLIQDGTKTCPDPGVHIVP